jgi:hypothetical protein
MPPFKHGFGEHGVSFRLKMKKNKTFNTLFNFIKLSGTESVSSNLFHKCLQNSPVDSCIGIQMQKSNLVCNKEYIQRIKLLYSHKCHHSGKCTYYLSISTERLQKNNVCLF